MKDNYGKYFLSAILVAFFALKTMFFDRGELHVELLIKELESLNCLYCLRPLIPGTSKSDLYVAKVQVGRFNCYQQKIKRQ